MRIFRKVLELGLLGIFRYVHIGGASRTKPCSYSVLEKAS